MIDDTGGLKDFGDTRGPLGLRQIETPTVPSSNIPMLADAAPGDSNEALLSETIDEELVAGSRLGELFNDGPAFFNGTGIELLKNSYPPIKAVIPQPYPNIGDVVTSGAGGNEASFASTTAHDGTNNRLILQDTRDWYAVHGVTANVLMADGSVKLMVDLNGDGFFNPGFPADGIADPAKTVAISTGLPSCTPLTSLRACC